MLKYLLIIAVLGLGYEAYVKQAELKPYVDRIQSTLQSRALVTSAQPTPASDAVAAALPLPPPPSQPPAASAPDLDPRGNTAPAPAPAVPFASQVAESQRQAVSKYPALAVANSEINSRFVFRYKRLVAEHSVRLQDATWPLQLADECAAASSAKPAAPSHRSTAGRR